jgi:L-fuculose-phosphate aldolase
MPNIWKLKQEICGIGRRMYDRGLVAAFEGNVSARLGPDRVLCTPSLVCKGLLKPEDLCIVDMTGKQIGEARSSLADHPPRKRSSEIFLHLAVYRERPDVEAVVHTHAPHAVAFAVTHTSLPQCVVPEVEVFLGEVPLAPYATPGTPELGESIVPFVHDANAAILSNHGVVSWGRTLDEAFHRTEILEAYCRTLLLARQLGPIQRLSDQNMRDLMTAKQKLGIVDRRAGREKFENCDLCGNNEFGRGYCANDQSAAQGQRESALPFGSSGPADVEAMIREIADRVAAEFNE